MVSQSQINKEYWYVVYTKPRQELRAKEELINQGVTVFLPMISVVKTKTKKLLNHKSQVLFARYLFIKTNLNQMALTTLRSTRGVATILTSSISRKPIPIPPEVIDTIRKMVDEWEEPPKVLIGQRVIISEGIAKGIEGVVQKLLFTRDGEERALILIDFLSKPQLWYMNVAQMEPDF